MPLSGKNEIKPCLATCYPFIFRHFHLDCNFYWAERQEVRLGLHNFTCLAQNNLAQNNLALLSTRDYCTAPGHCPAIWRPAPDCPRPRPRCCRRCGRCTRRWSSTPATPGSSWATPWPARAPAPAAWRACCSTGCGSPATGSVWRLSYNSASSGWGEHLEIFPSRSPSSSSPDLRWCPRETVCVAVRRMFWAGSWPGSRTRETTMFPRQWPEQTCRASARPGTDQHLDIYSLPQLMDNIIACNW